MSRERLQKLLARSGVAPSRRAAEELIREGRVTINGRPAELGESADPAEESVKVDGKRIHPPAGHLYFLLYKPAAVMSTRSDPQGRPTVMELIPPALRQRLVPVGRLDFATEGLLLLTDDGDFAQRVSHPRYGCVKTYEVKVKGDPQERDLDRLRSGIVLEGRPTAPARIERSRGARGPRSPSQNTWLVVELGEGRTRQIREMFFRIGHPVQRLRRVAIGGLRDTELRPGAIRELTVEEVSLLLGEPGTAVRGTRSTAPVKGGRSGKGAKPKGWAKAGKKARRGKAGKPTKAERTSGGAKGPRGGKRSKKTPGER